MSSHAAGINAGLEKQRIADEAWTTGNTCGAVRREGGSAWVCIREPHDAGHRHVDDHRRRTRGAVQADRHSMVSAPHLALRDPEPAPAVP